MIAKLFFLITLFLFTTPEFPLQANKSIASAYSDNLTPVKKGTKIQRKKNAKSKKFFKKKNDPKIYKQETTLTKKKGLKTAGILLIITGWILFGWSLILSLVFLLKSNPTLLFLFLIIALVFLLAAILGHILYKKYKKQIK